MGEGACPSVDGLMNPLTLALLWSKPLALWPEALALVVPADNGLPYVPSRYDC